MKINSRTDVLPDVPLAVGVCWRSPVGRTEVHIPEFKGQWASCSRCGEKSPRTELDDLGDAELDVWTMWHPCSEGPR